MMLRQLFIVSLLPLYIFAQSVTIYSECNDKPYAYCVDNEPRGISIEILKEIFSRIDNYSLEIRPIDWNIALEKMRNKDILMLGTMKYRPKERPYITDYSLPFLYKKYALYCNRDIKQNSIWPQDFYNLNIGYSKDFDKDVKNTRLNLKKESISSSIQNLIDNKIDCYLSAEAVIDRELLVYRDKNISVNHIKKVLAFEKSPRYIGFSDKPFSARKDLIDKINLSIRTISSSELEDIVDRSLDIYLNPHKKKRVSIAVYNWGEKLVSDKLEGYGAIPQIVKSAFSKMNIEVDYRFYNYKYAYLLTKWGKECISLPWLKNKEREIYFNFSDNIKHTGIYLFYRRDRYPNGINPTVNSIKEYKIGGVKGYYYESYFKRDVLFNYKSFETMNEAIEALFKGTIDIIPAEKNRLLFYLKKDFFNTKDEISYDEKPIRKNKNYIIFSKRCEGSSELRDEFNKGLKIIKESGDLEKILSKFHLPKEDFN